MLKNYLVKISGAIMLLMVASVSYASHVDQLCYDRYPPPSNNASPQVKYQHFVDLENCLRVAQHVTQIQTDEVTAQATNIFKVFEQSTQRFIQPIVDVAFGIFWALAALQLALTFIEIVLKGADLGDVVMSLAMFAITVGFALFLLNQPTIFLTVIQFFRESAAVAHSGDPASTFEISDLLLMPVDTTISIFNKLKDLSWYEIGIILSLLIAAILIFWALMTVAIQFILVMCEFYIVLLAVIFSLAFFPLKYTREYPLSMFKALVGTGFKLFTLEIVVAIGHTMAGNLAEQPTTHELLPYLVMAGAFMVYKEIAVAVPNYVQAIISGAGSGVSGGGIAAGITAMVAAANGAGTAMAGAFTKALAGHGIVSEAMKLSQAQQQHKAQQSGKPPRGGSIVQGLGRAGRTMSNIIGATFGAMTQGTGTLPELKERNTKFSKMLNE